MATVKGDVHDIGKNIVGVVLACNNFEIIDLGVMVPAQKIIDAAIENNAVAIGLSGLITPSLDEMSHVAKEMKRQNITLPLLIGGATTSRAHTALKIAPHLQTPVVWVKDASRAVSIAAAVCKPDQHAELLQDIVADYAQIRLRHAQKSDSKALVSLDQARSNGLHFDWSRFEAVSPNQHGIQVLQDIPLEDADSDHRLDAVLPELGVIRPISGHSERSDRRRTGQPVVRRRSGHAGNALSTKNG